MTDNEPAKNTLVPIAGLLVSIDPHYFILVSGLILYRFENRNTAILLLIEILAVFGVIVGYTYLASGWEAIKSVYFNLVFISDGGESMSILWYFYILCFQDFKNTFYFLFLVFPYVLIVPTVLNIKMLRDSYNDYTELPIDKSNVLNQKLDTYINGVVDKPEVYKKFETKDVQNLPLNLVNNYYMTMCLCMLFLYFMITKEYLVSFDFLIALPFLYKHWKLFSQSPVALLLTFVILFSYGGELCMWIVWQRRMVSNVNNYWTQAFINSGAWAFVCYVVNTRIRDKSEEYRVPTKYFYEEYKKNQ